MRPVVVAHLRRYEGLRQFERIITSSPVQNMGHLSHGVSLASPSHVLKYGFLTVRGNTGGVSFEASAERVSNAELAAAMLMSQCIE